MEAYYELKFGISNTSGGGGGLSIMSLNKLTQCREQIRERRIKEHLCRKESSNIIVYVTGYICATYLYCFAEQAGFYSDAVECRTSSRADRVLGHCNIFENGVLLMFTLEGVSSFADFITAYKESQ